MTKHLLVIGTSFTDSNLLRLVYEVAESRKENGVSGVMGTIVTLEDEPARRRLLEGSFDYVAMTDAGAANVREGPRLLEVFLDLVAMHAADQSPHLLDPRYRDLLDNDAEREVAEQLTALAARIAAFGAASAWQPVAAELRSWGARSD